MEEKLGKRVDQVKKLSHAEKKKRKKERIKEIKKKYEIPKEVPDQIVDEAETKIRDGVQENVQETENEIDGIEGNIAETLVTAAENDADHDITVALSQAQQYHQKSGAYIKQNLKDKEKKLINKLFGNYFQV